MDTAVVSVITGPLSIIQACYRGLSVFWPEGTLGLIQQYRSFSSWPLWEKWTADLCQPLGRSWILKGGENNIIGWHRGSRSGLVTTVKGCKCKPLLLPLSNTLNLRLLQDECVCKACCYRDESPLAERVMHMAHEWNPWWSPDIFPEGLAMLD